MPKSLFSKEQDLEIAQKYHKGISAGKIANDYGCYKQSILNSLKRSKINRRKYTKRLLEENVRRIIKGYIHIRVFGHPHARKDGYIAEHRIVMENKLGRFLLPEEVVNHIDRNIKNNNSDNLELFANNGEHLKMHVKDFNRDENGKFIKL